MAFYLWQRQNRFRGNFQAGILIRLTNVIAVDSMQKEGTVNSSQQVAPFCKKLQLSARRKT
jgi:hypothetical protein